MWGGVGGGHRDIEVAPSRLKSLRLGSGEVIYSLEFSYYDHDGREHTVGPWGGHGPEGHGKIRDVVSMDHFSLLRIFDCGVLVYTASLFSKGSPKKCSTSLPD
jgi:hypothetical protein